MAEYYVRADGTAANKAAAVGPATDATKCMSITTHVVQTFAAGDIIYICDIGGIYTGKLQPPSSGSVGNFINYYGVGKPVFTGLTGAGYSFLANAISYVNVFYVTCSGKLAFIYGGGSELIFNFCVFKNSDTKGISPSTNTSIKLNNCSIHGNAQAGIHTEQAGAVVVARNCLIYGNVGRGIFSNVGTIDYDYCLISGNSGAVSTNITGGTDGGHNLIQSNPGVYVYKNGTAYFIARIDDNLADSGVGGDAGYAVTVAAALTPYSIPINLYCIPQWLTEDGKTNIKALRAAGHEIGLHSYSHSSMAAVNAFALTSTNAAPTCDIDVAGHTITLATTTPGNTVVFDWAGDKEIQHLQTAVVGKGWTITPTASPSVSIELLLSSLADSAGAQAVPYTALLDRTADTGMFFVNEITYSKQQLETYLEAPVTTFSYPFNTFDAGVSAYMIAHTDLAGASAAGSALLSSINIFNLPGSVSLTTEKGDGSESVIRRLARSLFAYAKENGQVVELLAHKQSEFSTEQWGWIADELYDLGAQFVTVSQAIALIKTDHSTADGITYTKTYSDLSNEQITSTSDAKNAGADAPGAVDLNGSNVYANPIGAYSYQYTRSFGPITTPGPLNVSATVTAGTTYPAVTIKAPLGPEFQSIGEWTGEAAVDLSTFVNTDQSIFGPRYGLVYRVPLSAADKVQAERYCGV